MSKIERRIATAELRIGAPDSQGDEMTLVGYASTFNTESEDLGGFRETVLPGAFARSIREGADVKFLMNHDPSLVMGRTKNSTLKLEEDGTGLRFRVILPSTQAAKDLHTLVKRGDISQCSFAFSAREQSWEEGNRDGNGDLYASRKLMDVDLMDVSAVTYPAYAATEVYAREKSLTIAEVRDAAIQATQEALRSMGCPEELIEKISERSKKASKEQAETAKSKADHQDAAAYHEKEAAKAGAAGNNSTADAHKKAADAHKQAAEALGRASQDGFKLSHEAKKLSKKAHGTDAGRSLRVVRSGNERQPFSLEMMDTVNPADPKLKEKWFNAFNDKYMELMKKGGQGVGIEQAMAQAIAYAYEVLGDNALQTEVTPEVSGQKKDPTSLPHKVVDTDGDDDATKWENSLSPEEKRLLEARIYKTSSTKGKDVPDYVPADKAAQWAEVWNSAFKKAKKDGKSADDAESSAFAQANAVAGPNTNSKKLDLDESNRNRSEKVSDPDCDEYDPDDPDYDESLDETKGEGRAARYGEDRDGKTKTVAGKVLHAKDFAWVGDPNDPSTWKLPIHDEGHARNALLRFNQTQGIPADKKDGVWRKIVAAAKKFGTKVTEEDSIRSGVAHAVTLAILEELTYDPIAAGLRARQRLIEIDLD